MEAINPEDTNAVQIHSVDNIVNEIRQLTSKLQSSDAFNSSVRSPVPETQAFRSPHDSESQFFQPYKESVSRDPERSEDDMESAIKIQENVTKGLSLHSRLDQALKNSNQIQRQPSQGNATTEPFSATSQELNARSDNITFNQGVRSSLPRPALQLSSRSEVLEKYSQGPPSMSRIPVAHNAEAEFNNPFASARPSNMGELRSPVHDTPNYKINASNNSPPISTGFQPSAHVSASNFFTQTVPSSTGLEGYNKPPLGFSSVPQQEVRPTSLLGIKIEDQAHHSASKPIYNKDKLDRILSGIKNRGASPAPGIAASLNIGASDRSQTKSLTSVGPMLSPTASHHSFQFDQRQTSTLPPSLDIPKLSHYGSVPQMRSDVFSPTNAFSQRNLNLQQYASYSTAGVMPTVLSPQNLVQSTAMYYPPHHHHPTMFQHNNNYYGAALSSLKNTDRKMPFTPSEGPLRTPSYTNSRASLQYNEKNYQQLPQTQGFHAELYDEEDSHAQELKQKPRKFASGRKGTGSKRKLPTRENENQGDLLWGQVENDDDSLVMGHFVDKDKLHSSKKPNQGVPGGFGALEEDVSYISRPSIRETPKVQAQLSQLTQQSQPRQRSTRRERSRQRNAKQQEALQKVITDSILGSGPAVEEPVVEGRVERPRRNSRKPVPEAEREEQPEQPVYTAVTTTAPVDKRDEFVPTTKKSTYTQGMELRRGGSSQKLKPQERAKSPKIEHSSEFQLREESTIKNTRLLAELERGLEISGSSEIKKNTHPEMLNNGETLSDFEFKGSNIELVETPEQRGRRRDAEEESPQRDEDSVTRAFEHAKLEKSSKKSPKKSPQRRVTREGVAMKTEMVFKGKTSRRKIVK